MHRSYDSPCPSAAVGAVSGQRLPRLVVAGKVRVPGSVSYPTPAIQVSDRAQLGGQPPVWHARRQQQLGPHRAAGGTWRGAAAAAATTTAAAQQQGCSSSRRAQQARGWQAPKSRRGAHIVALQAAPCRCTDSSSTYSMRAQRHFWMHRGLHTPLHCCQISRPDGMKQQVAAVLCAKHLHVQTGIQLSAWDVSVPGGVCLLLAAVGPPLAAVVLQHP